MKHNGLSKTRQYSIFKNMKQRCYNPNNPKYDSYGGKGITICDEWLNDFTAFYEWSLENGYDDELTIDRIDSNKGYSPDNCRWVTFEENRIRKNDDFLSIFQSERKCLSNTESNHLKDAYPIILTQGKKFVVVFIPDFNINTQGKDMPEAIEMARDAIGLMGIDMQDDGKKIPKASDISTITAENGVITLVDVDFDEYKRKNELRSVKKNCTIPSWLNYEAEKAGVNFSNVLQNALMEQLHLR